jgi:hypothetical protein
MLKMWLPSGMTYLAHQNDLVFLGMLPNVSQNVLKVNSHSPPSLKFTADYRTKKNLFEMQISYWKKYHRHLWHSSSEKKCCVCFLNDFYTWSQHFSIASNHTMSQRISHFCSQSPAMLQLSYLTKFW